MCKRRWFYWLWLVVLCLLLGVIDALRSHGSAYHNGVYRLEWWTALRWNLSGWIVWVPLIPLILRLCDRLPIGRENWPSRMLMFAPLGLFASSIHTLFPTLVELILEPIYDHPPRRNGVEAHPSLPQSPEQISRRVDVKLVSHYITHTSEAEPGRYRVERGDLVRAGFSQVRHRPPQQHFYFQADARADVYSGPF